MSFPPGLPSFHPRPDAGHFSVPASAPGGVVGLKDTILALVRLTEGVTSLFAHALDLPDLADGLLELLHPGPVVLDVVFLDLLDVVIGLRSVHALGVFPGKVTQQAEGREHHGHQVEDRRGEEARDDPGVLGRESKLRGHGGVSRYETQPEDHAAWDGDKGVLRPDVRDESSFPQNCCKHGSVQGRTPDPVTGYFSVALWQVPEPYEFGNEIGEQGMVEAIQDPGEKAVHFEESSLLAKLV